MEGKYNTESFSLSPICSGTAKILSDNIKNVSTINSPLAYLLVQSVDLYIDQEYIGYMLQQTAVF